MPTIATWTNQRIPEILASEHFLTYDSRLFDAAAHIALNANNERLLIPGMIVAISTVTNNYVPYNAAGAAAYGAGCDTPIGILRDFHNCTLGDKLIEPIVHGRVHEGDCYVYGQPPGVIPAAVVTALDDIVWI
jgi:hypothetical protein